MDNRTWSYTCATETLHIYILHFHSLLKYCTCLNMDMVILYLNTVDLCTCTHYKNNKIKEHVQILKLKKDAN